MRRLLIVCAFKLLLLLFPWLVLGPLLSGPVACVSSTTRASST